LAITPATKPMIIVQMMLIVGTPSFLLSGDGARDYASGRRPSGVYLSTAVGSSRDSLLRISS